MPEVKVLTKLKNPKRSMIPPDVVVDGKILGGNTADFRLAQEGLAGAEKERGRTGG